MRSNILIILAILFCAGGYATYNIQKSNALAEKFAERANPPDPRVDYVAQLAKLREISRREAVFELGLPVDATSQDISAKRQENWERYAKAVGMPASVNRWAVYTPNSYTRDGAVISGHIYPVI